MVSAEEIRRRVAEALPDADVSLRDYAGDSDHFEMVVVSEAFEGKSTLQRHRMVYAPLKDVLGGALHALALKTLTPSENTAG
jgi:stress-induced morphogen